MNSIRTDKKYRIFYSIFTPLFRIFYPMKIIDRENIPDGPCIICPNHYSWNDPIYVARAFTKKHIIRIMSKIELIQMPILGKILSAIGVFGVKRDGTDLAALKTSLSILKERKLLLFPEGTCTKDQNAEPKTGAVFLAIKANVPIVPVYIETKKRFFKTTKIIIGESFKPEIIGKKPTNEELLTITKNLMNRIYLMKQ